MKISGFKLFEQGCFTICFIATLCFTTYCLHQYILNEDTSLVHFRKYHNKPVDIYPAVSLCFGNYLIPSAFNHNQTQIFGYKRFLIGMKQDEEYAKLSYENVTMDIKEYIIETFMIKQFESGLEEDAKAPEKETKNNRNQSGNEQDDIFDEGTALEDTISWDQDKYLYVSANVDPYYKCWTFEIPYIDEQTTFRSFVIRLKRSVFRKSIRPTHDDFKVVISYPGQFLSARVTKSDWRKISKLRRNDLRMEFNIQNMIILRKRNKMSEKCKKETKRDDEDKLKQLVKSVGCRALHINVNTTFPDCKNQEQIGNASNFFAEIDEYEGPCRQVEKMLYFYDEYEESFHLNDDADNGYDLVLNFQGNTFMEIEQVRAYDFQNLIGNGGGYIGVFLGVALIQLPTLVYRCYALLQNMF